MPKLRAAARRAPGFLVPFLRRKPNCELRLRGRPSCVNPIRKKSRRNVALPFHMGIVNT